MLSALGRALRNVRGDVMGSCCGRVSRPVEQVSASVVDGSVRLASVAPVPVYKWKWSALAGGSNMVLDDEQAALAHIDAGNPGSLTVVSV